MFAQGFVATLFFGWLPLYLPELFPTHVRATGSGISYNVGRFATAGGVLAAGLLFTAFGDSALQFETEFFVRIRSMDEREQIESELRYRIDDLFREAGLVMAFPQRDLHLDAAAPLPVRLVDR